MPFDELQELWQFVYGMWARAVEVYNVTKDPRLLNFRFDCTSCEEIIESYM